MNCPRPGIKGSMAAATPELHVHVNVTVNGCNSDELKEIIVTTKDELLAEVASLKDLVTETNDDIARVLAKLDEALANEDLTEVATAVGELRSLVQEGDDALEAADPETPPAP
jgi:outer membrane murein-binding lipoprotein Lpp